MALMQSMCYRLVTDATASVNCELNLRKTTATAMGMRELDAFGLVFDLLSPFLHRTAHLIYCNAHTSTDAHLKSAEPPSVNAGLLNVVQGDDEHTSKCLSS